MIINFSTSALITSGRQTFQLKSSGGNYEFEASTIDECTEWTKTLQTLTENNSTEPYKTPCLAVINEASIALVQEGEKFWTDGFLRLLNEVKGEKLKQAVIVTPPEDKDSFFANRSPALCLVTDEDTVHYFFIRFVKELERLACVVQTTYGVKCERINENMIDVSFCLLSRST